MSRMLPNPNSMTQSRDSEVLPILVAEQLVQSFNFYRADALRRGICYGNELYELANEFNVQARLQAYQTACDLLKQEIPVVITAASDSYAVWVSLRSSHHQRWIAVKSELAKIADSLHPGSLYARLCANAG